MSAARTVGTRMLTEGVVTPSGAVLEVPLYPRHRVHLGADSATVDGTEVDLDGQDPRTAATAALVAKARRVRGSSGAVRAEVAVEGSDEVWHAVVTAGGELFDATAPRTGPGRGRWVAAAAAAAVLVLGAATTAVLMTRPAPTPVVAAAPAAPPTGTPTPYPQLPPPGFAGVADWSAPVAPGAVPVLTDSAVLTVTGTTGSPQVTALDPGTGLPAWSVPLPRGAATTGGLHLALIDTTPVVATSTGTDLLWWPLAPAADGTHPQSSVSLPPQATVSWAGTTPLVTVPGQHAAAVTRGALTDRPVPAGATALGATTSDGGVEVVAANSVGQLWRLTLAGDTTTIPAPTTLPTPAGATTLESVAGYTAPLPTGTDLLVTTWFTTDPGTRLVALLDAHTGAVVGSPTPAAAGDLTSSGWAASPRHQLGTLGPVLARTTTQVGVVGLPAGWRTGEVTDSAVYGTATTSGAAPTRLLVTPTGQAAALGSGSVPLGVIAGRAITSATTGSDTTLYGLPVATTSPTPTPSVTASAPPPLPSAAPTPAKAATPTRAP
ncbi:hypothetical protein GCM10027047_16730 [Rhodococcus aerolatus]